MRRSLIASFFTLALFLPAAQAHAALTDNLLTYWNLDESSGNPVDSSGNGKTLTNTGSVAFAASLINNGADYSTTATGKRLQRSDTSGASVGGSISFSLWTKLNTDLSGAGTYEFYSIYDTQTRFEIYYDWNGGTPQVRCNRTKISVAGATASYNITLGTSSWHHIACTYDGSTITLYVDGTSRATASQSGVGGGGSASCTVIGNNITGVCNGDDSVGAKAKIDEVGMWQTALDSTAVTSLYNGGAGFAYPFVATSVIKLFTLLQFF